MVAIGRSASVRSTEDAPEKVREIQSVVSHFFGVVTDELVNVRRCRRFVLPRFAAIGLVHEFTDLGNCEIGIWFGGRDHTTVINALRRVAELRRSDAAFASDYLVLRRHLSARSLARKSTTMEVSMIEQRSPNDVMHAVCSAVGVEGKDVMNVGSRVYELGVARRIFTGIAHYTCGFSTTDIAEFLGLKPNTVKRWVSEHNSRRTSDLVYAEKEDTAKQSLGLVSANAHPAKRSINTACLQLIAHPRWTPAQDLALLALKGAGHPLDVVAKKLCRSGDEVKRRFHQLRAQPNALDTLVAMQEQGKDMSKPLQVAA